MSQLALDAEALYADLLRQVRPDVSAGTTRLVGVTSGGVWLAQRLARDLGVAPSDVGVLSAALHRDDLSRRGMTAGAQTQLPFAVDDAHIVLLDDVLYTGRTVRAVLNELFDFGRPARVCLGVLVDRGGRELPIQPDYCAARVVLPTSQSLTLTQHPDGHLSFQVQEH